ncbi:MAG TPA: methyltransferase domain-containing protein [Acidimicrobiales bacterium]|nr:methyltransferase domain-containing protein [Acidimicrobiales bacterium]
MAPDIYTHGHQESVLRSHRWRTAENSAGYLLPHLHPGQRLLDVGCGPGTLTVDLAQRVEPGSVVGVDISEAVVDEAAAYSGERGARNVSFLAGDFRTVLPERRAFDVVHAHQVLQHLADPVGALTAMAALARPGGIVAVRDSDYPAFTWAPANEHLERWRQLYLRVARRNNAEPDAGRWLLRWAHAAGLDDVAYGSSTWTFSTVGERAWWAGLWAERCLASSFAQQAVTYGFATAEDLESLAAGWRRWAGEPDGVFIVVHGELLARIH